MLFDPFTVILELRMVISRAVVAYTPVPDETIFAKIDVLEMAMPLHVSK